MSNAPESTLWLLVPVGQQAGGAWVDDTVAARIAESEARDSLLARSPLVGQFPRQRVEVISASNPAAEANERYHQRGWTDGLPIVVPEVGAVKRMMRASPLSPTTILGELEPLRGQATLEKVAANAVMAGCRPEYFPIVVAAVQALVDPAFNLRGVQTTDENVAPLLVVSGPIVRRLGINSGFGLLGPGWRANASIGRALRLVMQNIGGGWPGAVSYAGLGQGSRYSLCIAEDESGSPWPSLHSDLGLDPDRSAITLLRTETVVNVTGGLEDIASAMSGASSAFSIRWSGISTVILSPVVARMLARDGLDKAAVRRILHARGRWSTAQWRESWLYRTVADEARWPAWVTAAAQSGFIPVTESPDDLTLLVAGGDVPVPQHAWCPTWGYPACRIIRMIEEG